LSYYLKFRIESNSYRRSQKSPVASTGTYNLFLWHRTIVVSVVGVSIFSGP